MFGFARKLSWTLARAAGALSLGLAAAGCGGAVDVQTVESIPADATPGPAIWELSDADTTIYLFGTVHALPPEVEWFDARVERVFTSSSELVTEIALDEAAASAQAIAARAMLADGGTLRELMSEENRIEYEEALVSLGLPVEALDPMEPWFAAMNLSLLPLLQSGYQVDSGVEMALEQRAGAMTRGALETIEQQVDLFDTLPIEAQLEFLDGTVAAVPEAANSLDAMVAEWVEGDAVTLAEMMNAEVDDDALYQRLLIDRNTNWVNWIEQRLAQPGSVFVAVGAGHLAGTGSVQDQLRDRGYQVTRVWH